MTVMTPHHEAFNALTFLDDWAKNYVLRGWSRDQIINIHTAAQVRKYQVTKYTYKYIHTNLHKD